MLLRERNGAHGETNQKRVAKVQRRHSSILITELVLRPDTACAFLAMYRVHEAIATRLGADGAGNIRIGQKPRRHARPEREDDEGEKVADGHCTATGGVELGSGRGAISFAYGFVGEGEVKAVACRGVVEEEYEEEYRSGYVDERVDAVGPIHEEGMLEEPVLYGKLPEDVETLLEVDDLEGMLAGDVDGGVDQSDGSKGTTELIHLK
jgi:hypothetical protein